MTTDQQRKRPELITCRRTEAYLITTQVLFKPPFQADFKVSGKCQARLINGRGLSYDCWMLFADHPPCKLLNRRSDELSKLAQANRDCWLWDRNNRCCLQATSQSESGTILTGSAPHRNWQFVFWQFYLHQLCTVKCGLQVTFDCAKLL